VSYTNTLPSVTTAKTSLYAPGIIDAVTPLALAEACVMSLYGRLKQRTATEASSSPASDTHGLDRFARAKMCVQKELPRLVEEADLGGRKIPVGAMIKAPSGDQQIRLNVE
jgi:hypothetical protein